MKITAQVKLLPISEDAVALAAALETMNEAANWLSKLAFTRNVKTRQGLQRLAYQELKTRFRLSAQPALHCLHHPGGQRTNRQTRHAGVKAV